ncbi:hypothetical protein SLE2022_064190 [Rubroshorea leprosula]
MAKVAGPTTLPSLQIGGNTLKVGPMAKRKTPSELRGEQLRRKNIIEDDESHLPSSSSQMDSGSRKPDLPRVPRYIDTRMDGVYPAKKTRFSMPTKNGNDKENGLAQQLFSLQKISASSNLFAERRQQPGQEDSVASSDVCKDDAGQAAQRSLAKCSQGTFVSVTLLSSGGERSSGLPAVDLDKALKGLAAHEPISSLPNEPSERLDDHSPTEKFCSEFNVPGQKIPLDLTLKTFVRLVSSSSVNWFHRSIVCSTYNGVPRFTSQSGCSQGQNISNSSERRLTSQILNTQALHSWVYPQSTLPPSVISVLASAADGVEMDFLRKRQRVWEDSFRSLYYMFRKNCCHIFYVCTSHFVVMFTAADDLESSRRTCNAYISKSTGSLRSLLKQHDICFSMPLCHSKVEQVTTEDLVELSEIEKHNLGQAQRQNSFSEVDNTPQSLLAFSGNENVHGLYEILLNYRYFLTFLAASDVPMLCSPMQFQNAAISTPEVRCMEIKRVDHVADLNNGSFYKNGNSIQNPSTDVCYCIEIKDTYLPPWIISSVCAIMGSEGRSFEASFTTECTSIGLNVALGAVSEKTDTEETVSQSSQKTTNAFGISETFVSPYLSSGLLKSLNYSSGSYTVSLSSV